MVRVADPGKNTEQAEVTLFPLEHRRFMLVEGSGPREASQATPGTFEQLSFGGGLRRCMESRTRTSTEAPASSEKEAARVWWRKVKDSRSGPVPVAERHNFKESGNQQ